MLGIFFSTCISDLVLLNSELKKGAIDLYKAANKFTEFVRIIRRMQSPNQPPDYYESFDRFVSAFKDAKNTYLSKRIVAKVDCYLKAMQTARDKNDFTDSDSLDSAITRDLENLPVFYRQEMEDIDYSSPPLPDESREALDKLNRCWREFQDCRRGLKVDDENRKNRQRFKVFNNKLIRAAQNIENRLYQIALDMTAGKTPREILNERVKNCVAKFRDAYGVNPGSLDVNIGPVARIQRLSQRLAKAAEWAGVDLSARRSALPKENQKKPDLVTPHSPHPQQSNSS